MIIKINLFNLPATPPQAPCASPSAKASPSPSLPQDLLLSQAHLRAFFNLPQHQPYPKGFPTPIPPFTLPERCPLTLAVTYSTPSLIPPPPLAFPSLLSAIYETQSKSSRVNHEL